MWKTPLFSLILFVAVCTSCKDETPTLYIAGDSTAQSYDLSKTTMCGWGQMLSLFTDGTLPIENRAKAGRSTKSFRAEGLWDALLNDLKSGDWVAIQFGHNDTTNKPDRYSSPDDFRKNLISFIEEVRAGKANPILLTPLVMRTFQDGNLIDDRLKTYPSVIREVAAAYQVPLIDVNLATRDLILEKGDEASKSLYVENDDTHLNEEGAREVAGIVAEGIKALRLKGLYKHFK